MLLYVLFYFFFFKQKTAYEMRISDWSSDVCSSDTLVLRIQTGMQAHPSGKFGDQRQALVIGGPQLRRVDDGIQVAGHRPRAPKRFRRVFQWLDNGFPGGRQAGVGAAIRSEEHTSELQSLMRISYAVFCLK